MALTGDRARARSGRAAAARWVVPLTLLLTLAAALFPALRCSPALDAHDPYGAGVSAARAADTPAPYGSCASSAGEHRSAGKSAAASVNSSVNGTTHRAAAARPLRARARSPVSAITPPYTPARYP